MHHGQTSYLPLQTSRRDGDTLVCPPDWYALLKEAVSLLFRWQRGWSIILYVLEHLWCPGWEGSTCFLLIFTGARSHLISVWQHSSICLQFHSLLAIIHPARKSFCPFPDSLICLVRSRTWDHVKEMGRVLWEEPEVTQAWREMWDKLFPRLRLVC